MKTSEQSAGENTVESRGFMETLVGGLAGGTVGVLIGLPIANTVSIGGLEAIATALLTLFLALCVGAAVGAGVALKLRSRRRPLITAFMTLPAMFIGAYVAVFIATRLTDTDVLLLPFLVIAAILALLAARATATTGHGRRGAVRED